MIMSEKRFCDVTLNHSCDPLFIIMMSSRVQDINGTNQVTVSKLYLKVAPIFHNVTTIIITNVFFFSRLFPINRDEMGVVTFSAAFLSLLVLASARK